MLKHLACLLGLDTAGASVCFVKKFITVSLAWALPQALPQTAYPCMSQGGSGITNNCYASKW